MSLAEMQACLARLYVDDSFRGLFYTKPDVSSEEYFLSKEEDAAIREIDRRQLESFAESLKIKRRKRMERQYSTVFSLGHDQVNCLYQRYSQLYTPVFDRNIPQDIVQFGRFLEESLPHSESLPRYASELARLCRISYEVRLAVVEEVGPSVPRENALLRLSSCNGRIIVRQGVRIEGFTYKIAEIEHALQRGETVDINHCAKEPHFVVFRTTTDDAPFGRFTITAPTKMLLDLCNEPRSIPELIERIEVALRTTGLKDGVLEMVRRLISLYLLNTV